MFAQILSVLLCNWWAWSAPKKDVLVNWGTVVVSLWRLKKTELHQWTISVVICDNLLWYDDMVICYSIYIIIYIVTSLTAYENVPSFSPWFQWPFCVGYIHHFLRRNPATAGSVVATKPGFAASEFMEICVRNPNDSTGQHLNHPII